MRALHILVSLLLGVTIVGAGAAAADDHHREGWFLGLGGIYVEDFFEQKIEGLPPNDLGLDLKSSGGLVVRGGYRVNSWFATEIMYEWVDGMRAEIDPDVPLPPEIPIPSGEFYDHTTHSIVFNFKFLLPMWRVQPYLGVGVGAQYSKITFFDDTAFEFVDERWNFLGRPAFGIDWIVSDHWLLNVEVAGELAVSDINALDTTDLFFMSVGGGIQYRF